MKVSIEIETTKEVLIEVKAFKEVSIKEIEEAEETIGHEWDHQAKLKD